MSHRLEMVAIARCFFVVLILAVGGSGSPRAQDDLSANYIGQGCRDLLANVPRSFPQGLCFGVVDALIDASIISPRHPMFCPPNGSSLDQPFRLIVSFLDRNPRKGHERFTMVALEALREAWPCR